MNPEGTELILERCFSAADQAAFAALSGDHNPLHVDEVVARRLIFGAPVVHGVHLLLWCIDALCEPPTTGLIHLLKVKAVFSKPVAVGDAVSIVQVVARPVGQDVFDLKAKLMVNLAVVAMFAVRYCVRDHGVPGLQAPLPTLPVEMASHMLDTAQIEAAKGTLSLHLENRTAELLFPQLSRHLLPQQLAIILATTRIVGVYCPGLNSVYSEIALAWSDEPAEDIRFNVTRFDQRFGLTMIEVFAPTLKGELRAFHRPPPREQAGYLDVLKVVTPGEFAGCRALIIGGSRGLGEVTAKLLCAGGGEVRITYHRGAQDAERIVADIGSHGGNALAFQYSVSGDDSAETLVAKCGWIPTHVFYFATPPIFTGSKGVFSDKLFINFCEYFVIGFHQLFSRLKGFGTLNFFLPSSSAIDEKPAEMSEYVAAKAAAEAAAQVLQQTHREVTILQPRLPRLATDQTVSIAASEEGDPVPVMLQQLRSFVRPEQ